MLLEVIVISILAGWLVGGKVSRLTDVRLVGAGYIIAAFAVQALVPKASAADPRLGYLFHVGSYLILLVALSRNEPSPAIALMAAGIFLNFIVISFNGGMPVAAVPAAAIKDAVHIAMDKTTRLPWLGDVIPWPLPGPLKGQVSPGDLLLAAGIAVLIIQGMRYTGRRVYSGADS